MRIRTVHRKSQIVQVFVALVRDSALDIYCICFGKKLWFTFVET